MLMDYVADYAENCNSLKKKKKQTDLPFPKESILLCICVPKSLWSFKNVMHN